MANPKPVTTPSFEHVRVLALDLLDQNVEHLLRIRERAEGWNESRNSRDLDVGYSVMVVAEMLRNQRARKYPTVGAFSFDLGKMASLIALAKGSYSRENADYWYALSYTNAAFMVVIDMLELVSNAPDEETKQ
ncbi:hypothetical protein [Achromobacter animicus]|uniref:hypothetical protein n=1 Tax=Achromobacter animicus TaxID=1389935 RepID=UPI00146610D2|nr:hypothetical protein [Achromobacter animicus]CAB3901076.1 hypothetical protein LMG26691_04493 [Achromobacter animicus]